MKRVLLSLVVLGLAVFGLSGLLSQGRLDFVVRADNGFTLKMDVACDCRTFKYNRDVAFDKTVHGDGFLTKGKIFPAGTLRPGAQTNDPNDPVGGVSPIGKWVCRGQQALDFGVVSPGDSSLFFTQYHMMSNGGTIMSDGFDIGPTGGKAAVTGGLGPFIGVSGDATAEIIGTNVTGCPNIRFTFNLKESKNN